MNTERHILSAFDRDLETVQALVVKMGGMVEAAIAEAGANEDGTVRSVAQIEGGLE